MNERDSEIMAGLLIDKGFKVIDEPKNADVVIINTCAVRQHAEDRVWSQVGLYKDKIIGIVGCMAQNNKESIFKRAPSVKFIVGPQDIHKLPSVVEKAIDKKNNLSEKINETKGNKRPESIYHSGFSFNKGHAYVVISEGCSNFCSYCVVPYVRGPLRHRPIKEIIKEIRQLVLKGISKITLLGQNVNSYQDNSTGFIELLEKVNSIEGIKEFSFLTSHPKDTPLELFSAMERLEKLNKWLHLPMQSGSNRILKLMNRGYSLKHYLRIVNDFRKVVKNGKVTTDVIIGFPSETEEDFLATYDAFKKIKFNAAYIFKYSPRPKTKALTWEDNVPQKEKERRHKLILELQRDISNSLKH